MAFLDEDEMGRSGKLGTDKNLGLPRHDSTTFLRFQAKCLHFGGILEYFEVLKGACRVANVWRGLPGCG